MLVEQSGSPLKTGYADYLYQQRYSLNYIEIYSSLELISGVKLTILCEYKCCNIPRVESVYGGNIRALFGSGKDHLQFGFDFSSLISSVLSYR